MAAPDFGFVFGDQDGITGVDFIFLSASDLLKFTGDTNARNVDGF